MKSFLSYYIHYNQNDFHELYTGHYVEYSKMSINSKKKIISKLKISKIKKT